MIKTLKKQKLLFLTAILLAVLAALYFNFKDQGVSYVIPPPNEQSKTHRMIHEYMGQDIEWFLYTPDRVPLYVQEMGVGETIVALHGGFGMSHDYMHEFLDPFKDRFHIVYYDQRGSMRSPVPENDFETYITMDNMVNDLELLRRELNVEKLKIIAHSMGAVLAYEYIKKYPDNIGDIIIISGFSPKFPSSNAEFFDMFKSQQERATFSNRPEVKNEIDKLKATVDTTSAEFTFLNFKINSSALSIYDVSKWNESLCGAGYFNPYINEIIGPESNIPLHYGLKFYLNQRKYNKGTLDSLDTDQFNAPINYMPIIQNHKGRIDYLLGTHEVGDWNLRFYKRNIKDSEKIKMHIFQNAGHNIWVDKPTSFHEKLEEILIKT